MRLRSAADSRFARARPPRRPRTRAMLRAPMVLYFCLALRIFQEARVAQPVRRSPARASATSGSMPDASVVCRLPDRWQLLHRCAASSLAEARDHRRFAPLTGFATRSRRTHTIIYLGFESLWNCRWLKELAEREEAVLVHWRHEKAGQSAALISKSS
jgi:hypothetical protein